MTCPYLFIKSYPATGEIGYHCEWCEEGMMRTCNSLLDLPTCPLDKYGVPLCLVEE